MNEEIVKSLEKRMLEEFKETGKVSHIAFFIGDGEIGLQPFKSYMEVEVAVRALKPETLVIIGSGWSKKLTTNKPENYHKEADDLYNKYKTVQNFPGRREVVILSVESCDGSVIVKFWDVERPDGKTPSLVEQKAIEGAKAEGRYVHILQRVRGTLN